MNKVYFIGNNQCRQRVYFLVVCILFYSACQSPVKKNGVASQENVPLTNENNKKALQPFTANYLYAFSYPADSFFSLLRKPGLGTPTSRLILRNYCKNLWETDMQFGLMANATSNHGRHGSDHPEPVVFLPVSTIRVDTQSDSLYVFGNSEVSLKAMETRVVSGGVTLPNFHQFIFYPERQIISGELIFRIYPADAQGKEISKDDKGILIEKLYSNPSPPRQPL